MSAGRLLDVALPGGITVTVRYFVAADGDPVWIPEPAVHIPSLTNTEIRTIDRACRDDLDERRRAWRSWMRRDG